MIVTQSMNTKVIEIFSLFGGIDFVSLRSSLMCLHTRMQTARFPAVFKGAPGCYTLNSYDSRKDGLRFYAFDLIHTF